MNQVSSDYLFSRPEADESMADFYHSTDSATSPESAFSPTFSAVAGPYSLPSPPTTAAGMDEWMWDINKDAFLPQDLFNTDPAFAASPAINPMELSTRSSLALPPLPSPLDEPSMGSRFWPSPTPPLEPGLASGRQPSTPRKRKSASTSGDVAATSPARRRHQQQPSSSPSPPASSGSSHHHPRTTTTTTTSASTTGPASSTKSGAASASSSSGRRQRRAKNKSDHGEVEQRYRNKLNAQIAALRDAVPRSRDAYRLSLSSPSAGAGGGIGGLDDDDGGDEASGDGTAAASLTKGAILTQAAAYIADLERRNRALEGENSLLRARVQRRSAAASAVAARPLDQDDAVAMVPWC